MEAALLQVQELELAFERNQSYRLVLSGVEFSIQAGETLALVGESGSGKSLTSFSIIKLLSENACFSEDSQILFDQQDLLDKTEKQMTFLRGKEIAMIFQEPMTSLNPVKSIGAQIEEAFKRHQKLNSKQCYQETLKALQEVGIREPERVYLSYPHQLSGGMKQRVMIAIALAGRPKLLIADEPTSALDVSIQAQIIELLQKLQQQRNMAMLFITHDLSVVKKVAHHVAVMYAGHLVEQAPAAKFFERPLHPYSQKLLECLPKLEANSPRLATIAGQVVPLEQLPFHACRFQSRCLHRLSICSQQAPSIQVIDDHQVRCWLNREAEAESPPKQLDAELQNKSVHQQAFANGQAQSVIRLSPMILNVEQLSINYWIKRNHFQKTQINAVKQVSFQLAQGKTLALVGESGSGKTTIARALIRLVPACSGQVYLGHQDILSLTPRQWQPYRRKIQMVFQDPFASMNPRMTVENVITEGLLALRLCSSKKDYQIKLKAVLDAVGLTSSVLARYPHEFSGGQRQRIALARALIIEPEILLLDEPTSALDVSIQAQILNLLKDLQAEKKFSYLIISHNLAAVAYLADEIAVLQNGELIEMQPTELLLKQPIHPYTRQLLEQAET